MGNGLHESDIRERSHVVTHIKDESLLNKQSPTLPGFEHMKRAFNSYWNATVVKILPGEYYVTRQDEYLMTVLGSCVSACVRDCENGIGGMNHFLLPLKSQSGDKDRGFSAASRYGNFAMEHLINAILKHGGCREALEVKIFGGAQVLTQLNDIGKRNIDFVREYIRAEGLRLVAEDVGDVCSRKLVYHPISGRAKIKKLHAAGTRTVAEQDRRFLDELDSHPLAGEVELF